MKKRILKVCIIIFLIVGVISILLFNSKDYVDVVKNTLDNAKIIKLYDYKTKDYILEYNKDETEELIKNLEYGKWQESNKLNGDEKLYLLKIYKDEDSEDIGTITVYKSMNYVEVKVKDSEEIKIFKTNKNLKKVINTQKKDN